MPNIIRLVKKTDYDTKITETEKKLRTDHNHDKYITTLYFHCKIKTSRLSNKDRF